MEFDELGSLGFICKFPVFFTKPSLLFVRSLTKCWKSTS
jgi:hypothetical protein